MLSRRTTTLLYEVGYVLLIVAAMGSFGILMGAAGYRACAGDAIVTPEATPATHTWVPAELAKGGHR